MTHALIWLTDTHFDSQWDGAAYRLGVQIGKDHPGRAVLHTGDISTGLRCHYDLEELYAGIQEGTPRTPQLFFVTGNHDLYGSSREETNKRSADVSPPPGVKGVHWLGHAGIAEELTHTSWRYYIAPNTIIVGADGWYDGYYGNAEQSPVRLRDWSVIRDLETYSVLGTRHMLSTFRQWAAESAAGLTRRTKAAIRSGCTQIVIGTHVPPYRENSTYQGKISDDNHAPWFSSRTMGDAILTLATDNPGVKFLALSGHTHATSEYRPRANVLSLTNAAEYGRTCTPRVLNLLDIFADIEATP